MPRVTRAGPVKVSSFTVHHVPFGAGSDRAMFDMNFPRGEILDQLQTLLLETSDVSDFLNRLAVLSTQVMLTEELSCGITMRYEGNMMTVASSDERAERLDETQYRNEGGPCLQAIETGEEVLSSDTRTEQRWPAYTATAQAEGLRCSVSLPLSVDGSAFGALNVYGFTAADSFGEAERRQYRLFAAQAAGALRLATRQAKNGALLSQLEQALNSRTIIDQALGVLIGRYRLSATGAFDVLRAQSQNSHRKLRDVAADLVTEASGQPPSPGRSFQI